MMGTHGSDDDVVTFGHFSEVRKVKSGPADEVKQWNAAEFDAYTANEMQKQGFTKGRSERIDPRSLRNGVVKIASLIAVVSLRKSHRL